MIEANIPLYAARFVQAYEEGFITDFSLFCDASSKLDSHAICMDCDECPAPCLEMCQGIRETFIREFKPIKTYLITNYPELFI